jgi:outer membrane protein assembly factor BamB
MLRITFFLFAASVIFSCKPSTTVTEESKTDAGDSTATTVVNIPGLKYLWETEKTLTTAESVLYDKTNNLLYVSCINGTPLDKKDGDGFISRVGLDGKIMDLKWATGLSAPRGMGQAGNTLYVTDIDRLVSVEIPTGKILKSWNVKGASFLNDLYITEDGKVYFTDSNTSTVYTLANDKIEVVLADTTLGGTNGILVEGKNILLASSESGLVFTWNMETKELQKIAEEIPGGDGIERYGEGLLVSNWNGEVHYISANGEVTEILDTQEAKLNAADIEIIADKNLLLVPTFYGNGVTAYELSKNN